MSQTGLAADRASDDAYRTTGTSPSPRRPHAGAARRTLHLLGPGAVGRALLRRIHMERYTLVAVTDSTATLFDPHGLDADGVATWKSAGRPLREHPRALAVTGAGAIERVAAAVVIDATSSDLDRAGWTAALDAALQRGTALALAAKPALCEAGARWLTGAYAARIGCNAVLGGTGRSFLNDLGELRRRCRGAAIVGSASTTAIIEAIENGASPGDGIAEADRLGFLEPDPELDLRGTDATVKLAIVAGVLTGRRLDPRAIPCPDIRSLDVVVVRGRARQGRTTRLVARLAADGSVRAAYEDIPRDSLLATPCGRVVYEYRLDRGERRLHVGSGLGAQATADALWEDVRALCIRRPDRAASVPAGGR